MTAETRTLSRSEIALCVMVVALVVVTAFLAGLVVGRRTTTALHTADCPPARATYTLNRPKIVAPERMWRVDSGTINSYGAPR